ncbi:MAG TPA: RNA polymerase sigma factor [Kouleothrix sp.]|uniref:RNA polymerase sigma factor n=1 Tax=Kouleothrix sp. TaxID=2779161 RepID=UPI002C770967|nr:RNA polymerase sigma factor [Kouleothrix sp.]HRC78038.1 RNA polymerase sigma factor [Kouleothrix sp.]
MNPYRLPQRAYALPDASADAELMRRVCMHDEAALREIYQRHRRLVARVAWQITRDETTADEVVQDVFQAAWQAAARFEPGGSIATWLAAIARNRAVDALRSKLYRQRQREEWLGDPHVAGALSAADTPEALLVLHESLRTTLARLAPQMRATVELYLYAQLSPDEIAQCAGLSVSVVRRRLRYGLHKLRDQLAAEPSYAPARDA